MTIHELKILPEYFEAVACGDKTFELRKNDKNYAVWDQIVLKEFDGNNYTGRKLFPIVITYILEGCEDYGLFSDYCILGFDSYKYSIITQGN